MDYSNDDFQDYDLCAQCNDKPAMIGDPRFLDLDFCSKKCADALAKRQVGAELERQTEISSGGQH
jgi:hypothetical protein